MMNKYTFKVDMVGENLDAEKVIDVLQTQLDRAYAQNTSTVKSDGIKKFSEQGYKVWRARVTGVTAKEAGDAHNNKVTAE
tara:strand:- start:19 stop:258 length:240 start_codon:yes stop_codon:yes gene_type:complete